MDTEICFRLFFFFSVCETRRDARKRNVTTHNVPSVTTRKHCLTVTIRVDGEPSRLRLCVVSARRSGSRERENVYSVMRACARALSLVRQCERKIVRMWKRETEKYMWGM